MRTFSAAAFLSIACATGIYSQNLGSFDTFMDTQCSEGREGVTIPDLITYHTVSSNFASVKSYSLECDLLIWIEHGDWCPLIIPPCDSSCYELYGTPRGWRLSCPNKFMLP
ncbi:hypothetical protein CI102_7730 [Trichoderma harzianum]|nr:hypothetical protein CI102_7730 [Trichoderma harzianum]